MKTILYFLTLASLVFVLTSCEDEDKIHIPEAQTGVNMRWVVDPAHAQINYQTVSTDFYAFDAYSENTDLNTVEVTAQFGDQVEVMRTLTQSDFVDGKARVELRATDFASAFEIPGFADGTRGGTFVFRPRVTLNDGRVYPDYVVVSAQDSFLNIGTGILGAANGAFTLRINGLITCTPLDISGTYLVISATGTSTDPCCPDPTTLSGNSVQITMATTTTFTVSDLTGGLYFEWYDVFGISSPEDTPATLQYNCGEVNIINSPEPFGTLFQGGGTFDNAAGRITYTWTNGFADEGTVVLQRQ